MKPAQLSFLPDNDHERRVTKPSVPVCKLVDGRWCWLVFGTLEYRWEPELERILLAAIQQKAA